MDAQSPGVWWPTLDFKLSRQRSVADTRFVPAGRLLADFSDSVAVTQTLGLAWQPAWGSVGYEFGHTRQDERRPGAGAPDQRDSTHKLSLSGQAGEALSFHGELGLRRHREPGSNTAAALPAAAAGAGLPAADRRDDAARPEPQAAAEGPPRHLHRVARDGQPVCAARVRPGTLGGVARFTVPAFAQAELGRQPLRWRVVSVGSDGEAIAHSRWLEPQWAQVK